MTATYLIEYKILSTIGSIIKEGKVLARRKKSEKDAIDGVKSHFKGYLKHYDSMLVVDIQKKENNFDPDVEYLMNMFGMK